MKEYIVGMSNELIRLGLFDKLGYGRMFVCFF